MAGGTWTSQNKALPGVYMNFRAAPSTLFTMGDRGVVAICEPLSWGPVGKIMSIEAGEDVFTLLGYDGNTDDHLLFLRELFRGSERTTGAKTVLLFRPTADGAVAATATLGSLKATALWPGLRGNALSVSVEADPDASGKWFVTTRLEGRMADRQQVGTLAELKKNDWVSFTGTGAPAATVATALTGGTDGTIASAAHSAFLAALETYQFNVVACDSTDATVADAYVSFVTRMRDSEGRKCQVVLAGKQGANSEAVIQVKNGAMMSGNVTMTPHQMVWWVAGCTAGATCYQSLTNAVHPLAVDVVPRLTSTQMADAVRAGDLVLMEEYGQVKIVADQNTLTAFSAEKSRAFSKNLVIRVLDTIGNDIKETFSKYHIGKTNNDANGRDLLKKEIVGFLRELQAGGGVRDFVPGDVTVLPGTDVDSVVVNLAVRPVDAVEKIYMTVTVA